MRIGPIAGRAAHHAAQGIRGSVLTRHLPEPFDHDPHLADRRRLVRQRGRRLGGLRRGIPYGRARATSASPVLALVAGIVVAAGRGLLVALLASSPALLPGGHAAASRTVALTAVTATTDGEGPTAAPAEPAMKSGSCERRQGSLLTRRWTPPPACARLTSDGFASALSGPQNDGKPRCHPGFSFCTALPAYRTRSPRTPPPPRYARDDVDFALGLKVPAAPTRPPRCARDDVVSTS